MSTRTRHSLGIALLFISALAGVLLQFTTGHLIRWEHLGETQGEVGWFHSSLSATMLTLNLWFALPLLACSLAGLFCLILPSRKHAG